MVSLSRRAAIALTVTALAAPACREPTTRAAGRERAAVVVVDDAGRRVALPRPAGRVAALSPGHTEILHALGLGSRQVLRDPASDYPPEVLRLPAADPFRLSPDRIAAFRPDIVLLSAAQPGRLAALDAVGIPVASFDPKTFAGVLRTIRAAGVLLGAPGRGARLAARLDARRRAVVARVSGRPRPRTYVELEATDPARPWTCGPGSFVGDLLAAAGGTNVFGGVRRPYAPVAAEAVLAADPDVIVVAIAPGEDALARLVARPGWSRLRAVRGHRVHGVPRDILARPGPRLADALEAVARAIHPRAFAADRRAGDQPVPGGPAR